MNTIAPTNGAGVIFDQEGAFRGGLPPDSPRPESERRSTQGTRRNKRFTVALASAVSLLVLAAVLAAVFHNDAASAHAHLRATQRRLASTQSRLHSTEGTLHRTEGTLRETQNSLDTTQRDLATARDQASSAQSDAAHSKDVINALTNVHNQITQCVNAWGDFANGFLNRLIVENNALIPHVIAVCNSAIEADNALTDSLKGSPGATVSAPI